MCSRFMVGVLDCGILTIPTDGYSHSNNVSPPYTFRTACRNASSTIARSSSSRALSIIELIIIVMRTSTTVLCAFPYLPHGSQGSPSVRGLNVDEVFDSSQKCPTKTDPPLSSPLPVQILTDTVWCRTTTASTAAHLLLNLSLHLNRIHLSLGGRHHHRK